MEAEKFDLVVIGAGRSLLVETLLQTMLILTLQAGLASLQHRHT